MSEVHEPGVRVSVYMPEPLGPDRPPEAPLYLESVSAGFPSPAGDYVQDFLDLQKLVVKNPAATFFLRVSGASMSGAGINDGDLLVVDRSRPAVSGRIVIAALEGELTVKRLKVRGDRVFLVPENPDYSETEITGSEDAAIWGVVTFVVHRV